VDDEKPAAKIMAQYRAGMHDRINQAIPYHRRGLEPWNIAAAELPLSLVERRPRYPRKSPRLAINDYMRLKQRPEQSPAPAFNFQQCTRRCHATANGPADGRNT
jgi:hypothetical protein